MSKVQRHLFGRRVVTLASAGAAAAGLAVLGGGTALAAVPPLQSSPPPDQIIFAPSQAIGTISVEEGQDNVDSETVAQFVDTGALRECAPSDYSADINWSDNSSHSAGTITCGLQTIPEVGSVAVYTVDGSHTYKDSGTFFIVVTVTEPDSTKTSNSSDPTKAEVSDAEISTELPTVLSRSSEGAPTEGDTVRATACFLDNNSSFSESVDPGLTATISWGDGSTSSSATPGSGVTIVWPDSECGNVGVSGSHLYDANIPATHTYSVKITLSDDGGKSATSGATDTPAFADAKLTAGTAKSFTSTPAQASSNVVASFTDAAGPQAAAADFTATIKWGDNTTSSGTVTKTGTGAFNVSGTHTYATSGTKSLTITVTDEEGQTLTMSATATVPALPATGRPHGSANSGLPLLPLAPILLGLIAVSIGIVRTRLAAR